MKVFFMINTPGQAHTWKPIIDCLKSAGHEIRILVRNYRHAPKLLDKYGLEYSSFQPIKSKYLKFLEIASHMRHGRKIAREFYPDIIIGFGVDSALTAASLRKPCIVLTDAEPTPVQHWLNRLFASIILTPSCFQKDLGKKHLRFEGYKELAYLHPNHFQPDPTILGELGVNIDEKYVILRFNAFDAAHDIGRRGFSFKDKYRLVHEISEYAHVFISTEGNLPHELEEYRLPIPFHRLHHALNYAHMLVGDTGTMVWESGILGIPTIACGSFVGDFGNFIELEQKYNLIHCFQEPEQAIKKAIELVQQQDIKGSWTEKRQNLLHDKIDVTEFISNVIDSYSEITLKYTSRQ